MTFIGGISRRWVLKRYIYKRPTVVHKKTWSQGPRRIVPKDDLRRPKYPRVVYDSSGKRKV